MIICIVGKSGSGKSTITNMLYSIDNSFVIIDGDKVSHDVLKIDDVKNKIKIEFGNVFDNNFNIDRQKLRSIVFNNQEKLKFINELSWKYMEKIIDNVIDNNKDKNIIIDWLLSPLTKYFDYSDLKILVDAPYDIRMARVLIRDNISSIDFKMRDNASPIIDKEKYDYIINNIDTNKTKRKVRDIYDKSIIYR